MARRLLITGASGFLGSHLLRALAAQGRPGDAVLAASRGAAEGGGARHLDIDLTEEGACGRVLAETQPTHIVHLAGAASVGAAAQAVAETWKANFHMTFALAEAAAAMAAPPRFVLASSGEVYGATAREAALLSEDMPLRPAGVYARTKAAAEMAVGDLMGRSGAAILRLFNSIGPGQDERFVAGAFAAQVARIEAGLAPPVLRVGNLDSVRDFIDAADTAEAIRRVLDTLDGDGPGVAVFNVCSGEGRSIASLVEDLKALAARPFEVETDPARARPSEIPRAVGDNARLRARTGWSPATPWRATLQRTLDDWRARLKR
ncbi:MAG: GDP-mannose 4,6-dehydratase [Alphaproteobacteria bacterium]